MRDLWQDLRFTLHLLRRSPGFAVAVVLTLGLGIGANVAIFSLVDGIVLRPLPLRHEGRLVHIRHGGPETGDDTIRFSVPETLDFRRQSRTFEGLLEYHSMSFTLLGAEEPDQVQVGVVSANFCNVLGIQPVLGRAFLPDDEQLDAPPVLLLGNRYWHRRFGGDPRIVGRSLRMNGHSIQVVGVLPPLPDFPGANDVFVPPSACPFRASQEVIESRDLRMINLYGLLRQGVGLAQARAEISLLAERQLRDHPETFPENARADVSLFPVREELNGDFLPLLEILQVTVILLLLVTCANVGNLSLARLLSREREVVLRTVLGAGRRRLMRQLLTESMVLALLGGFVGLAFAAVIMRTLTAFAGRFTPLAESVAIDGRVLLFTLVIIFLSGLLFGLLPALHTYRRDVAVLLRSGAGHATQGPGRQRLRSILVVLQVAVSFILLIAAGLTTRSAVRLQGVDAGFDPTNVIAAGIELSGARYPRPQDVLTFYGALLSRIDALPGVVSSAVSNAAPLLGDVVTPTFRIEGRSGEGPELRAASRIVSPAYFRTLGVPLLAGRTFLSSDDANSLPVVIITQSMARHFRHGESPLGKRIELQDGNTGEAYWATIVGIVGDVRHNGLDAEAGDALYRPLLQGSRVNMNLFVRTNGDPTRLGPVLRHAVYEIDPEQSVSSVETMDQVRSASAAPARLTATLFSLFAILAFVITVTGLNGVVVYSVTERTQEIGIRSALGAERIALIGLVMRQGMLLVLLGLVLGWAGALGGSRLLSSVLYGVQPSDFLTFVSTSLVLLACGAAACFFPAWRAAFIDPVVALRS